METFVKARLFLLLAVSLESRHPSGYMNIHEILPFHVSVSFYCGLTTTFYHALNRSVRCKPLILMCLCHDSVFFVLFLLLVSLSPTKTLLKQEKLSKKSRKSCFRSAPGDSKPTSLSAKRTISFAEQQDQGVT